MNNDTMATTKADPYQDPSYQPCTSGETQTIEHHHHSPAMQAAIDKCLGCHKTCLSEAMNHCLEVGGLHIEPHHFRLMLNCAEMCQTSAHFMLSNSPFHAVVCDLCAQLCEACAEECDAIEGMADCAVQCRNCAISCREMAMHEMALIAA